MDAPKPPLDPFPYPRDSDSRPIQSGMPDGVYVYVRDRIGTVHVLPDGPHRHPRVLGGAEPALYAGDLRIEGGCVADITNLSGTFRCDEPVGLLAVVRQLRKLGLVVAPGAVRFFPQDGSAPRILE